MKKFALLLIPLVLSGCLGYEEEMWIESDGSGRLDMTVRVSQTLFSLAGVKNDAEVFSSDSVAARFSRTPGIRFLASRMYESESDNVMEISIAFDSLGALNSLGERDTMGIFGRIRMFPAPDHRMTFERKIDLSAAAGDKADFSDSFAMAMIAKITEGYTWRYIVHFPSRVLTSNAAPDSLRASDVNTAAWSYSLASLLEGPRTMTADIARERKKTTLVIVLVLVAAFLVAAGIFAGARCKRRRE